MYKIVSGLHALKIRRQIKQKKSKVFHCNPGLQKLPIDAETAAAYRDLWEPIGHPSTDWIQVYAGVNGIVDHRYTPEYYYYTEIEPRLNNKIYTLAYADKNFYQLLDPGKAGIFPKTFLRKINGEHYDPGYEYLTEEEAESNFRQISCPEIVLKPSSESAGGRDVLVLKRTDEAWKKKDEIFTFESITKKYPLNYIIQEKIEQHPFFAYFNVTSVNTIRLFTYRSVADNAVIPLHAVLRVGKKGSQVDNQAAGGYSMGISAEGKLNGFAIDKMGRKYHEVNGLSIPAGQEVPGYAEICQIAREVAPRFFYNRILGFDFCISKAGEPKLLEVNLKNIEINFLQMNNGPLFGKFTEEVIAHCAQHPKSVNFDFYV